VAPDKNFALIDVLEHMGIDFTALLGGKVCCGVPRLAAGDLQTVDFLARNLVETIQRFSPKN
jgi:Fe-S oxidoreductase